MISKQQVKFVKSLKLKKYRNKAALFLVEGAKSVAELIKSNYQIEYLFVTEKFLRAYPEFESQEYELCTEKELVAMGTFQSNEYALAVARIPDDALKIGNQKLIIALDEISDPGNLGTIIRIADWYAIDTIIASPGTADVYNPKVINASMGSFARVRVHYTDLLSFFKANTHHKVLGAALYGEDVHQVKLSEPAILLMGSESKGISSELENCLDQKITIPRLGGAESLNVAVSTAVICDQLLSR